MSEAALRSSGFTFTEAPLRSMAGIAAFRDQPACRAALHTELGLAPPITPAFVRAAGVTLSCVAPGRYLAAADRAANLPARLGVALAGLAAVTDQSDLWHIFSLSGPGSIDALGRLVPIDLATECFPAGALALTRAGHLNVRLWHLGGATYELAVARSYADDLRHLLQLA